MTRSRPRQDLIQIASRPHPDHIQTASRLHLCHTNFAKTILQPERRRREGQRLPDVWRSIIPYFRIFSVFLVVLNSLVFCVVSTVLRVRCYLHLRWHYFSVQSGFGQVPTSSLSNSRSSSSHFPQRMASSPFVFTLSLTQFLTAFLVLSDQGFLSNSSCGIFFSHFLAHLNSDYDYI